MATKDRTHRVRSSHAKKETYATPALEKGLDVLELLARQSAGLTKSEISRQLNRTISEIFRMLVCLERRGYIAQSTEDRYSLTLKLFKMVQEHPPTERLIAEALPVMHRLVQDVRQSCHLGIIEGAEVVILSQVNAPTSVGFFVKIGSVVELAEASTGYVILAYQSGARLERTLEDWRRRPGRRLPEDLPKRLARIRRVGYEKRPSYKVRGITNISYPIFDERGYAICALTIPYIQHNEANASLAEVNRRLRKAASDITAAIGGRWPEQSCGPHAKAKQPLRHR